MDGFSGTKCGTGLQKKWWGDKEPSDKSSIWYKGGCPFVYDANTKSWVHQSTSGGGGSPTGLAILKSFIDSHNYYGYDYTGVTIGVKADGGIYANYDNTVITDGVFKNYSELGTLIAFNTETNIFYVVSTTSGKFTDTKNFIFVYVDYSTEYNNYIVCMPDPTSSAYKTAVQNIIDSANNGTPVNYDDLK